MFLEWKRLPQQFWFIIWSDFLRKLNQDSFARKSCQVALQSKKEIFRTIQASFWNEFSIMHPNGDEGNPELVDVFSGYWLQEQDIFFK